MYGTIKRDLTRHLKILDHYFVCFDLSVLHCDEILIYQLKSLSQSISCLRFIVEGFALSNKALPSIIENDIRNQIITIADIAQLLLHKCGHELREDSKGYLEQFIMTLKTVYDDINSSII
jgi:hypothetical protein